MDEIEEAFPEGEPAWSLRKLGILRDTGRKGRKIACVWSGYDIDVLLKLVAAMIRDEERG